MNSIPKKYVCVIIGMLIANFTSIVEPNTSATYILNQHLQLVTSSSLKWLNAENGSRPLYSVQGGHNGTNNSFFICRSSQGGTDYDIGHLTWEGCNILTGEILQLRVKYQVLVNLEGSARLMWKNWQQFSPLNVTVGAVNVAQDIYVAREHARQHSHRHQFIGGLHLQKQYGVIILPAHPSKSSKSKFLRKISTEHRGRGDQRIHHYPVVGQQILKHGQFLVELTPKFYEITSFTNGQLRDVSSSDVTLPRVLYLTPENFESGSSRIFRYKYEDSIYFGKGHHIPTGSDVRINNGTTFTAFADDVFWSTGFNEQLTKDTNSITHLQWGLAQNLHKIQRLRLAYDMPPNSRTKVHIKAIRVERRIDYFATLASHYNDGAVLMRPIKGVYVHVTHEHLRPVFEEPIFDVTRPNKNHLFPTISTFNNFNLSIKMEIGMSSTENPENNVHNIEDSTKAVDETNDIAPNIRTPKRIRPEKQNNKQEVFDQLNNGLSIHSSISTNLFELVIFTFVIISSMLYHQNIN